MFVTLLMSCALLGADDTPPAAGPSAKPAMEAYQAAQAKAGKNAADQVRLALWCEAHGLSAERLKHLALAVVYDPSHALARGLLGLVTYRGEWKNPDQVSRAVQDDPDTKARIQEYLQRRVQIRERADDHWKLALWCEQNGLKQQATAHLYQVLRLDRTREAAWKHLGFKRLGGHWDKPERVAAAKAEAQQQHKANKHWKPLLEKWSEALSSRDKTRRTEAEKSLSEVTDPRAVPMIWVIFVPAGLERQRAAVKLLGQIDSPGSSRALALLALLSRSAEVKRSATQTLRKRDPRDFASVLIALLRDAIKYEVRPVNGPGSRGELLVKSDDRNVKRLYSPLQAPQIPLLPTDRVSLDSNGLPVVVRELGQYNTGEIPLGTNNLAVAAAMFGVSTPSTSAPISSLLSSSGLSPTMSRKLGAEIAHNANSGVNLAGGSPNAPIWANAIINRELDIPIGQMMLDAQRMAQVAQQQLAGDVQAIDAYNAPILESNQRVREVLRDAVGADLGADRTAWQKWMVDLLGYAFSAAKSSDDQPTVVEQVPLSYQPQAAPIVNDQTQTVTFVHHSCFGAGTPVQTLDGLHLIEKLRTGDVVLTQEPTTGELKYQPLIAVYHNPPNTTFRIELDQEAIVATGIHRFWKAGRGWVMARELKPGDALRTLGGLAVVKSVEKERIQPVFNLRVAEGESFFVGRTGVLAHDNSLVNPTPRPFDAVPELGAPVSP
ncbi:MAG: polymorphic toxin-type HINT domain-containing protein [Isosphaerales bacterium]